MTENKNQERRLMVTMTNEPFMPVRLYYTIPSKLNVIRKLKKLKCMVEDSRERCWVWLFDAEAASLEFEGGGYNTIPEQFRPIVLGRIRFPKRNTMTLEINSSERAIAAARFFGSRLGPNVVAIRCRVINRCFGVDEGHPRELLGSLDRNVTVIDPLEAEDGLLAVLESAGSPQEAELAMSEYFESKLKSENDVPEVEDFPLAPEEETSEYLHLATSLQFRSVRAIEHWRGNTHLTLMAIVNMITEQGLPEES